VTAALGAALLASGGGAALLSAAVRSTIVAAALRSTRVLIAGAARSLAGSRATTVTRALRSAAEASAGRACSWRAATEASTGHATIAAERGRAVLTASTSSGIAAERRGAVLAAGPAGLRAPLAGAGAIAMGRRRIAEPGSAVLAVTPACSSRGSGVGHGRAVPVHVASELAAGRGVPRSDGAALSAPGSPALEAALGRFELLARKTVGFRGGEHEGGAALGTGDVLVSMFHCRLERWGVAVSRKIGEMVPFWG